MVSELHRHMPCLACGHTKDEITDYPCTCGCHLDIVGNK